MDSQQIIEMKTDMRLLLECLDYQRDNSSGMKQALVTLASCLQGSGESRDEFREGGGLQQVLEIVKTTKNADVIEAGLYCLGSAVESNVYSQKLLSSASVFTFLHGVLSEHKSGSIRKKQTAAFLLLCLVSNNGFGQNLLRQSSCLHDVITLIRTSLPKNTRLPSGLFEGVDGISIELWSTLVSTACVCVNNPQNEENQRICATLFPYLFSLLQHQQDKRIIKPIFSLLGLAVSNNVQNQDRVRKCGGLEIFVKKLDSLQNTLETNPDELPIIIQLLNTIDSCIAESELNCEKFGSLGGVQMVLQILADCPLNEHDKTQAVLTLAHALDACNANQMYVTKCDGITVLIHQLTITEDPELSRTIKYLLHICVASGRAEAGKIPLDEHVSKDEQLKRQNELEILQKINELDSKLKTMENASSSKNSFNEFEQPHNQSNSFPDMISPLPRALPSFTNSVCGSNTGDSHHVCVSTPREQSLIDQLVQEKLERQKLEYLNKMLQENMLMRNMMYSKEGEAHTIPKDQNNNDIDKNNSAKTRSGRDYYTENLQTHQLSSTLNMKAFSRMNSGNKDCIKTKPALEKDTDTEGRIISTRSQATKIRAEESKTVNKDGIILIRNEPVQESEALPLDLSSKSYQQKTETEEEIYIAQKLPVRKNELTTLPMKGHNRHAEIQCGTPYVDSTNTESVTSENKMKEGSIVAGVEKSNFLSSGIATNSRITVDRTATQRHLGVNVKSNFVLQTPVVVITDINKNKELRKHSSYMKSILTNTEPKPTRISPRNKSDKSNRNRIDSCDAPIDNLSQTSNGTFVKPKAMPPKSKVRVTPSLGKLPSSSNDIFVKPMPPPQSPSNMSILSEFDRQLVSNVKRPHAVIREPPQQQRKSLITPVIKSQNNVRKLDQHLGRCSENAAESWHTEPSTPKQQGILLPRPAFSDCGMRRPVLDSVYSVMSVGKLSKQNVDDSGFESPDLLRNVSSDTSSVDSNVDGLRSDSDEGEEQCEEPSITKSALRSGHQRDAKTGQKRKKISPTKCPETNPHTCSRHREVRQLERDHIQTVKKDLSYKQNKRLLERTAKRKCVMPKKKKEKESVFNMSSDSNEEFLSDTEGNEEGNGLFLPQRAKLRRRRIPYTDEEEFNLIEGVNKIGKHWNQILLTYRFHPSRTNVDLKDKYKRLMASERKGASTMASSARQHGAVEPFSMCEERRLRRGVKRCGYNWKIILQSFSFAKGRTTEDLRNRWRSMHRKKKFI